MNYHEVPSHRLMIRDVPRTAAFQAAISDVVKPGDVVLDAGAGVGVLSLFAAKAGAARVYAVERTQIASMASYLAQINGFADVVQVLQGDIRHLQLPEKVDVIVSEWMGSIGVDENLLGAVLWARDHFLKKDGRMIPQRVTALMAPVATAQRADAGFFTDRPYGLDLSPLAERSVHELLLVRRRISPSDLAAPPEQLWVSDLANDTPSTVREPYEADVTFAIRKASRVSALASWFSAELAAGRKLCNAPDAPDTHWGQLLLPLHGELTLKSGDKLQVRVTARSVGPGPLQFAWSVRVNDGGWSHQDTMAVAGAGVAGQELPELTRSSLTGFLADLAIDPELLGAFISDPDAVMVRYDLSEDERGALKSRDPFRIQEALYETESPA